MIELLSANTPNGWKISIMLEEIEYEYKITPVDLSKDEQFKKNFLKISPFGKIPVIIDHENNESVFESGAILIYLAEKSKKLYKQNDRLVINQWLMAQMGTVGPMLGQHHVFHHFNPGKSEYAEERYFNITRRIYGELDSRLKENKFLAGADYTIADIATWPWIARHEWHDVGLKDYQNLARWYLDIAEKPSINKALKAFNKEAKIPLP